MDFTQIDNVLNKLELFLNHFVTQCYPHQQITLLKNDVNIMQGGPGGILATVDGKPIPNNKYRCASLKSASEKPNAAYPGIMTAGFDDSKWDPAAVSA